MPSTRISFRGATGAELAGRLDLPGGEPRAFALLAHCFTCSKDLSGLVRIARALAERGFAVLRFDFTGLGDSGGTLAEGHFAANVGDLVAAAEHLRARYRAPALLVGHSLGGAAALLAAAQIPSVKAVATIGAPADPGHVRALFTEHAAALEAEGEAEVEIAGRRFRITREFVDALDHGHMEAAIRGLRRALLVLHAPRDEVVGIDNAAAIFKAAKHPKSFISLDDADHLLTTPADASYAAEVIAAWACRYVDRGAEEPALDSKGATVVAEIGRQLYRTRMRRGKHAWIADEPEAVGGGDLGPSPYDLVLAGLAACTSMTLRMYADRKGWPIEQVTTRVSFDRVHKSDCEECVDERGRPLQVGRFTRRIELVGEVDAAQRRRIVEIADKCPVHKLLTAANVVDSVLEEDAGEPAE
ncbi:MAG: alpha/beta fold hydrolase [Myxococcales bacterium]|nr:alpha/beta fold hydrolase [Myxococcales bacterium]